MPSRVDRRAYLAALCRNVPFNITERVLADPSEESIASQEAEGAVLYADLVGFTALTERLSREGPLALSRLSDLLTSFFDALLEEAFFPYGGYVIHFGGDSVTVIFKDEGFAERAAAAALAAQRIVDELPSGVAGTPLRLRVGIGSGVTRMIVVGDEIQRLVLAGGWAAHFAMLAQGRADPGMILVGAPTAELLRDKAVLEARDDDHFELKSLLELPARRSLTDMSPGLVDRVEDKISLLEPFVPAPLAARLKQMPDGWRIEGELRRVVVVFAEVSGFTRRNEALGFAGVADVLRFHRRYGGVQFKFDLTPTGHRTLSIFGLHAPTDNDPERAILACLDTMAELKSLLEEAPEIQVRMGVHVGEVYFGAIGSKHRYDITVIGDVVNVAARASSAAPSFQIVITDAVLQELSEDFVVSACDPIRFKGKSEPMALHLVLAATGRRARYMQRRGASRHLSGRASELDSLADAARVARSGQAQVVGIVGEAGSGKSCILADVIDDWLEQGGIGLIGRCTYVTRTEPLAPVRAMFAGFLGLTGEESDTSDIVRRGLEGYDLGEGGEALIQFLSSRPTADSGNPRVLDDMAWQQVIGAIERFVRQRVHEAPVLYVVEDLHLADSLTVRLVHRLAQIPRNEKFLFIVTYRSDPSLVELKNRWDRDLELRDLHLRDAADLVATSFGADDVDDEVAGFLWERTGGNPGRLVELSSFLRDRGLLKNHAQTVIAPPPGLALLKEVVPANMAQFALGRLEHLNEIERRLLRIAATIGRSFERDVLAEVAQSLDQGDIDVGVVSLIDEGVIAPEASRRPSYRFREEITRAVAYSTIPESERRDYHRKIADVLEKLSDADVERSAVTLAQHRERAHQFVDAAIWYERAIRQVVFAGLDEETRYLIAQWQRVVAKIPPAERPKQRTMANMAVRNLVATSRHGLATEAVELSKGIADLYGHDLEAHERAIVDLWTGVALLGVGEYAAARRTLKRAFDEASDSTVRCDAALYLFKAFVSIEAEADWWLDRAKELVKPGSTQALRVELSRACQYASRGNLDEARIINARIRDEARRRDQLRIAAVATCNLADCDLNSGDVKHALAGFEESIVMARALGTRSDDAIDQLNIGACHLYAGNADVAVRHLESSLAIAADAGLRAIETESMVHLGLALALTDDIDQGESLVADGRKRAEPGSFIDKAALLHLLHIALLRRDLELVRERKVEIEGALGEHWVPLLKRTRQKLLHKADEALREPTDPGDL